MFALKLYLPYNHAITLVFTFGVFVVVVMIKDISGL